ncbi:hypothetical protein LPW36_02350 [Jinshanibacter sp. LJY008]|uniref:IS1 family transposase n=1 Tax=Limnobaculum eriocheiris TaxID=2897391 RepID=A0A9X1SJR7_9GAMM|nr:hypothetical protein [Limnobaculum eriocheiris]MCD1124880.1 hypothetical protein [Limnobaculum eriocheiris]
MNNCLKKIAPICHYCGGNDCTKKHGVGKAGLQRYYCVNCRKTFQTTYIYKGKEQNIAVQIERLWEQNHTPEQISFEMQVRLSRVKAHIKELENTN